MKLPKIDPESARHHQEFPQLSSEALAELIRNYRESRYMPILIDCSGMDDFGQVLEKTFVVIDPPVEYNQHNWHAIRDLLSNLFWIDSEMIVLIVVNLNLRSGTDQQLDDHNESAITTLLKDCIQYNDKEKFHSLLVWKVI